MKKQLVAARLEKIVEERNIIAGKKLGENKYKLYSLEDYGDLAMIDKHSYYIDVHLKGQDTTSLIYRIRGNQTYLVIAVFLGFFLLFPILFLIGPSRPDSIGEGIFILFLGVLLLAGVLTYFLMRSASTLERKAESHLQYVIKKIESEN